MGRLQAAWPGDLASLRPTDAISYQSGQAYASTWGERSGVIAARLKDRGVTTSTIGFDDGYDEVLLSAIADAGSGNDYWAGGMRRAWEVADRTPPCPP